jgi:hypothetical protein
MGSMGEEPIILSAFSIAFKYIFCKGKGTVAVIARTNKVNFGSFQANVLKQHSQIGFGYTAFTIEIKAQRVNSLT